MEKFRISIKNIDIWLADQLSHPVTLFSRKSWGVFSVYAPVRRSDILPNNASPYEEKTFNIAMLMSNKYACSYSINTCVLCDVWHIAKESKETHIETIAEPEKEYQEEVIPKDFNLNGILASGNHDIASVYGGVRGQTLASPAQGVAWPIVKECGIKTIIDFCEDGIYARMKLLCDKFGMEYLYYPVDRKVKHVKEMVTLFP